MALDADAVVDRRRLKRSRSFWRFAAIFIVGFLLIAAGLDLAGVVRGDHVARITIEGVMVTDSDLIEALEKIEENDRVKAVIVEIDSPGGTVMGAETVFNGLSKIRKKKPVVAIMGTVAASGGYIAALPADTIFAHQNTITGSIGVIMQSTQLTGLLEKIGVSVEEYKSAPLKGQPSPFTETSDEARQATQDLIDDAFDWFVGLVEERRELSREEALVLADGRVFTGRQAVANGLIDAIGDETEARTWLSEEKGISDSLPIVDALDDDEVLFLDNGSNAILNGLYVLATGKTLETKRLTLDGLLAIWHP
jgi:protease-4